MKHNEKTHRFLHQGDVLLIPLDAAPEDLTSCIEQKEPVLAEGEVTGHAHRVNGQRVRFFRNDTNAYLLVEGDDAILVHEEHTHRRLAPGWSKVVIQKERSLEDVGWKPVID